MHSEMTDNRQRELRRLLEGMKAEPGRRQMDEAQRFIAIQRSIAVDRVSLRAPHLTLR